MARDVDEEISELRQIAELKAHLSGLWSCRTRLEKLDLVTLEGSGGDKLRRQLTLVITAIAEGEQRLAKLPTLAHTKESTKMETVLQKMQANPVQFFEDLLAGNLAKAVAGEKGAETEGSKRFSLDPEIRRIIRDYLSKPIPKDQADTRLADLKNLLDEWELQAKENARQAGWEDPDKKTKDLSGAASALGREAPGAEPIAKAAGFLNAMRTPYPTMEGVRHAQLTRQAAREMFAAARRIWVNRNTH